MLKIPESVKKAPNYISLFVPAIFILRPLWTSRSTLNLKNTLLEAGQALRKQKSWFDRYTLRSMIGCVGMPFRSWRGRGEKISPSLKVFF